MPAAAPSSEQIDAFFQMLEQAAPFPEAELAALAPPAVVEKWKSIGATQSAPWIWATVRELSLVSFLAPNARFTPLASFFAFSLSWMLLLRPGARRTPNLWLHHYLRLQALPNPAAKAALKERLQKLRDVSFRVGTGPLEGIGLKMYSDACCAAAGSFLAEGSQFLQWLQQELGLNKAIATQLWERMAWQRDVVNATRSFEMTHPFLGVLGAIHVEDVWHLFSQPDPLGARGRIGFAYTRPSMKRAREIHDANAELQNEKGTDKLEERIVNKFFAVYKARAIEHVGEGSFTHHLGYPFRNNDFPSTGGGQAETGFFDVFDAHAQQQEDAHLVQHEEAKKHGKLKGLHLRHALNWANAMNARGDVASDAWNTAIDLNALKAAQLIGDFSEKLADEMSNVARDAPAGGGGSVPGRGHAEKIRVTLSLSLSALRREIPVGQRAFTKALVIAMLKMQTIWLESTNLKAHSEIRDNLPAASNDEKLTAVWRCMALVKALQLGRAAMSTNPHGAKKMHLVKRSVIASDAHRQEFEAALNALGMEPGQYAAPTAEVADASRPQTAPALVRSAWASEAAQEAVTTLQQW
ncbi:unnamed protein product [Prorocentrum cordatum]|uniref:Selenoprotein O n=1 Tax=Prorocentrum cordatum TaxID=2364126 RepID=A0ABN9T870_9DINO|nr:unnamed protein product [Polarella glacialis]